MNKRLHLTLVDEGNISADEKDWEDNSGNRQTLFLFFSIFSVSLRKIRNML